MPFRKSPISSFLRDFSRNYAAIDLSAVESCLNLLNVSRELQEAMDAHFARHNLSKGRFQILMNLKHKGTSSPAELAEFCQVSRATVTGLLDTLEQTSLIERVQDSSDRRSHQVRLTAAAEAQLAAMLPDHYRRIAGLMQGLSTKERAVFAALLDKIESGIPAVRDP